MNEIQSWLELTKDKSNLYVQQIPFKNLKHIKPVNSYELANLLRESDIYITGSKNDPCSNALIEALSCGLPSVVLNDGGHPEILKEGGEVFNNLDECIKKIENVKNRYEYYRKKIEIPDLEQISLLYLEFIKNCFEFYSYNKNKQKKLRKVDYFSILIINKLLKISIIRKIRNRIQKKFPNLSVYPLRLNLNFLIDLNQD